MRLIKFLKPTLILSLNILYYEWIQLSSSWASNRLFPASASRSCHRIHPQNPQGKGINQKYASECSQTQRFIRW